MAKKSMILKQRREPKFSSRRYNRCRGYCGPVPTPTCVTTASAVSASASWLIRARSPA